MIWLIIKAVLSILPIIIQAVRDGRIKEAAQDEVLHELERRQKERIDRANVAKRAVLDGSVPADPFDPNRRD